MTKQEEGTKVDSLTPEYVKDQEMRDAAKSLRGGTKAMRSAGIKYLKKEEKETDERYAARLNRSFLFPAFDDTIERIVSKPFSREVSLRGELPQKLAVMEDNVDLAGSSLTVFANMMFNRAVEDGLSHVFVDMQPTEGTQKNNKEISGEVRPYFVFIDPNDLIGWKTDKAKNGEHIVVELRWRERRQEAVGDYGSRDVDFIRVIRNPLAGDGSFEIHRKNDEGDEYTKVEDGVFKYPAPGLPFFTHYTGRKSFMRAESPLIDLLWKNIEHWQKSSDRNQALRFASLIQLLGTGMTQDDVDSGLPLGHGAVHLFQGTDVKLSWVEAKGTSIKTQKEDIDALKEEMETLGLAPTMRKAANTTATSQDANSEHSEAPIQAWVRDLNHVLTGALQASGTWVRTDIGETVVQVFDEFKLSGRRSDIVKELRESRKNGDISQKTYLEELQRHGYLSDDVDIEDEMAALKQEKEEMAEMFAPDPDTETGAVDDPTGDDGE